MNIKSKISINTINRNDGLPSGQVHDLVQDAQGIFWFAGPGGLARYDGSRIKSFGQKDGLQTHGLRSLAVSADGGVFVGSDLGADVVEADGKIHSLVEAAKWRYGFVECLATAADTLWLGTAEGLLCRTDRDGLRTADDARLKSGLISALLAAKNGAVWAAGAQCGLLKFEAGEWSAPQNDDWRQVGACLCLADGADSAILLGGEKGLIEIDAAGRAARLLPDEINESVTAVLCVEDELWLGIGGQLRIFRKQAGNWRFEQTVLENAMVNKLFLDRIGNVWGATDSVGVFKISVLRKAVIQPVFPDSKSFFSIRRAIGKSFLLGGDKASWKFRTDGDFTAERIEALNGIKVWDIIEDEERTVWAATEIGLYAVSAAGVSRRIGEKDSILSSPGRVLLERADGIWVGTVKGLARFRGGGWEHFNDDKGHSFGYVYTLAEDLAGNVWIGTLGNGLWLANNSGVKKITAPDIKLAGNIYDIEIGQDGRIAVLQDNRIIIVETDGATRVLAESEESVAGWTALWKDGNLWVGSSAGLHEYDGVSGSELRRVTVLNGLSEWEFTTSRSLSVDLYGRLLCGVNGGLMIVNTAELEKYRQLPAVKLSRINFTNALVSEKNGKFSVAPGKWTLDVEAFTADFVDEDDTLIEFRLNGFDEAWTNAGKSAQASFNSLPPGDYTLETQARNRLIGKSPVTKLFDLHVRSPWWANGFLSVPFAAGEAALGLIESRRKNQRLLERTAELEKRVHERTAELETAMDALQSANRELQLVSVTDALTGVANRRNFDQTLDKELERARRGKTFIALIMIDVDCFKLYNDTYGHPQGDECLRIIAQKISASLRGGDVLARYGGEEFAIIVPNTDAEGTLVVAERTRRIVENLQLPHSNSTAADFVTISTGVGLFKFAETWPAAMLGEIRENLILSADRALYRAKETGRNRVVLSEENVPPVCLPDHALVVEENHLQ